MTNNTLNHKKVSLFKIFDRQGTESGSFLVFLLFLIAIICSTPLLKKSIYFVIPVLFAIYYIAENWNSRKFRHNYVLVSFISVYLVVIYAYKFIGISSAEWGTYMQHSFFFICIYLMLVIQKELTKRQKIIVLWLIIISVALNVADNIRLSILYPSLNLYNQIVDLDFYNSINAGGSKFYTLSLFYFIAVFFVFINCKKHYLRLVMLGLSVMTGVYICVFCNKAAVVVYMSLSVALLLFAKKMKSLFSLLLILVIISIIFVVLGSSIIEWLADFIITFSPSERLSGRLIALIDPNNNMAMDVSMVERESLWQLSVDTWLRNAITFFFGIGDKTDTFSALKTGIGRHSDFYDSLAKYGILGASLLIVILLKSFQVILACFEKKYHLQLMVVFFIMILCGFTKSIFFPGIGLIVYLLLPLTTKILD